MCCLIFMTCNSFLVEQIVPSNRAWQLQYALFFCASHVLCISVLFGSVMFHSCPAWIVFQIAVCKHHNQSWWLIEVVEQYDGEISNCLNGDYQYLGIGLICLKCELYQSWDWYCLCVLCLCAIQAMMYHLCVVFLTLWSPVVWILVWIIGCWVDEAWSPSLWC